MNGKECRATRREIDESELNQLLSDQARLHLAVCASCSDFRSERASLRELVGSLEPVTAPGDFEMRLRARIAGEQARARQPFIFRFVTSTPAIAAAALVVMMATALVWLAQRNTSQSPPTAVVPVKGAPGVSERPQVASSGGSDAVQTEVPATSPDLKPGSRAGRGGNLARENNGRSVQAGVRATDYGVSPAESIRQGEQIAGEVSLSAPLNPMVVSVQDDRGATRKISLPPVSFGAGRLVDNRIPVSLTSGRSW